MHGPLDEKYGPADTGGAHFLSWEEKLRAFVLLKMVEDEFRSRSGSLNPSKDMQGLAHGMCLMKISYPFWNVLEDGNSMATQKR